MRSLNGLVCMHWALMLMVLAGVALLGFVAGVLYVVEDSYTSARADLLQDLKHELRLAAVEGRPFFLPESNISFIPRADGHMNISIAGAGADVRLK